MKNFFDKLTLKSKHLALPFFRISIFIVYFWFGILKVFSYSPANPLVEALLKHTLPFMTFDTFIVILGIFEMFIGVAFLIPKLEKVAFVALVLHLIVVIMPLFLLPEITWQKFLVPTLEGQYIIKNILIVAVAIGILSHAHTHHNH